MDAVAERPETEQPVKVIIITEENKHLVQLKGVTFKRAITMNNGPREKDSSGNPKEPHWKGVLELVYFCELPTLLTEGGSYHGVGWQNTNRKTMRFDDDGKCVYPVQGSTVRREITDKKVKETHTCESTQAIINSLPPEERDKLMAIIMGTENAAKQAAGDPTR